jgi:hypothetical protein
MQREGVLEICRKFGQLVGAFPGEVFESDSESTRYITEETGSDFGADGGTLSTVALASIGLEAVGSRIGTVHYYIAPALRVSVIMSEKESRQEQQRSFPAEKGGREDLIQLCRQVGELVNQFSGLAKVPGYAPEFRVIPSAPGVETGLVFSPHELCELGLPDREVEVEHSLYRLDGGMVHISYFDKA